MRIVAFLFLCALAVPVGAAKPVPEPNPFQGGYRGAIGDRNLDIFLGISDAGKISVGGFGGFLCSNLDGSGSVTSAGVMKLTIVYSCVIFRPSGRTADENHRDRFEILVSLDANGNIVGATTEGEPAFFERR